CWLCPGRWREGMSAWGVLGCEGKSDSPADVSEAGTGLAGQILWLQFYFQTAAPTTDKDAGPIAGTGVDKGAQALLLAQRTDAAQQVTGAALGGGGVCHGDLLGASGLGQEFQVQYAHHRHHCHQQRAGIGAGQQRLEHLPRVEPELVRSFATVGLGLRIMLVAVQLVSDLGFVEHFGGGCHGRSQSAILTTILPKFCPLSMPMKAWGAFSNPSTRCSLTFTLPSATQGVIVCRNSGQRGRQLVTRMEPRPRV